VVLWVDPVAMAQTLDEDDGAAEDETESGGDQQEDCHRRKRSEDQIRDGCLMDGLLNDVDDDRRRSLKHSN
jgi:hypothetical protein